MATPYHTPMVAMVAMVAIRCQDEMRKATRATRGIISDIDRGEAQQFPREQGCAVFKKSHENRKTRAESGRG
jgi:hypothetical protein